MGTALLVTLAAMLLILTAAVTAARVAASCRLAHRMDETDHLTDDFLASAAETTVQHWLAAESAHIVLPPDVEAPVVEVLHDRLTLADLVIEIHITAYDQLGMTPIQAVRSASQLRMALPDEIVQLMNEIEIKPDDQQGLDLFHVSPGEQSIQVFPNELRTIPISYQFQDGGQDLQQAQLSLASHKPELPSIGAQVATHNNGKQPRVNVNTAPPALLEAAFRAAGRGGWEQVLAARDEGRQGSLPASPSMQEDEDDSTRPLFVSSSDTWAFRIDLRVNRLQRSWWAVYSRSASNWSCIQRLAIDE